MTPFYIGLMGKKSVLLALQLSLFAMQIWAYYSNILEVAILLCIPNILLAFVIGTLWDKL